jgi:CBS domain-containing protein
MSVGRICVREVLIALPDERVRAVATRLGETQLGSAVVIDASGEPLGILTDRDIAVRCVGAGQDPDETRVSSVMSPNPEVVHEEMPIEQALERMAGAHLRRLIVIDDDDKLVGILALDDVLELLVEETASIGKLLAKRGPPRPT